MRPPPPRVWMLPPYVDGSGEYNDARMVLEAPGRPRRLRLIIDNVRYVAELSPNEVRRLREWLEEIEELMAETDPRRPRGTG